MLSFLKSMVLFAIGMSLMLAGCAAQESRRATTPRQEFNYAEGTVVGRSNLKAPDSVEVKYNDGTIVTAGAPLTFLDELRTKNQTAMAPFCRSAPCVVVTYNDHPYMYSPLDGRALIDSELWVAVDLDFPQQKLEFQGCDRGQIYQATDLKTLMDLMDKLQRQPRPARSDPEIARYRVGNQNWLLHLPVCNWRHRIGLDKAYPPPAEVGKRRIVPASHDRMEYVEVRADKDHGVEVYFDEAHRQMDHLVFTSPKAAIVFRPVYSGNDCPILERCEHFVLGPEKQPDRFDIHTLDDEPLSQSRIFEVDDTVSHLTSYDGCAGGRLYTGKNRQEIENEVKIALENPAPPPVKGAPLLGAPETSESGDTVIPDALCDWTARRQQAEAAIKKSQPAQ